METRTPLGPLTPSQQNGEGSAPDFSKLTASQFGITPSSFTTFPKDKDKSRVAQLKSRRRSSIGVRGSPETNSLICFRAKQVMKTPPSLPPRTPPPRTPQHLLESPLFSGRDSIKQKMAAFQRLMETDEENTVMMKEEEEGVRHTQSGEADVSSASKKKRVRFGAPLSPEFFDKTLPPSTPLQKGATPACPPSSTGRKHSLLKTPQRFESLPQPDFSSPAGNGASPALNTHSYCNRGDTDEVFLDFQKIAFPIMDEEYDNPPGDSTAHHDALSKQTETTDAAVREDEGSHISCTAAPEHPDHPPTELRIEQEEQHQLLETLQFSIESSTEAPRSRGRKRKQPAKSEMTEARRSSRSAAESAKGKIKTSSAKKRFGAKEVDRSLYGKRDYASKNPLLSPIVESAASSLSCTPTQPRTDENPDSSPAFNTNPSETASSGTTADLVAAAALWRRRFLRHTKDTKSDGNQSAESEGPVSTVQSETEVKSEGGRVSAGRPARGRRNSAGRRQSWGGARVLDECEDGDKKSEVHQTESNQESRKTEPRGRKRAGRRSRSVEETQEELEQRGLDKTCEDTVECAGDEKEEAEKNDEDMRQTAGHEVEEKKTEDVRQSLGTEEVKKNDMDMRETSEQKAEEKNHEDIHPSSVPLETLETWQQPDFCIEDILKPVAKSRGSVRRSLRHRSSMDVLAKGLAWVEHTSPQMNTTNQRRTRGRLSAVSQPPPFPDEKPLEICH
ncbi:hypothetical protein HF521_014421 [Silurus meridionalis]|uniref:PP1-binding domain-containing protein n=1 Tax=Silurus meridionalis TaxID=175797 RepID=A0A8T0A853_SILME|nr:hypothetical protein HF521_014421 [Silurus meridionalis]